MIEKIDVTKRYAVCGGDLADLELILEDMKRNPTVYREVNVMYAFKILMENGEIL